MRYMPEAPCWQYIQTRLHWRLSGHLGNGGPTYPAVMPRHSACRCLSAALMQVSLPAAKNICVSSRAVLWALHAMRRAAGLLSSRSRPASSTSAVKRLPATSARTSPLWHSMPLCICRLWGMKGLRRSMTFHTAGRIICMTS